jgi:hypothetical protein
MSLMHVKPVQVTPAMLIASDVPETDHAAWAAETTYALDARVIVVASHKVYQSLQADNTGHAPPVAGAADEWWIEVSPTNRWKAFDLSNSTRTTQAGDMYFEIEPGQVIDAAAVLNCTGVRAVRYRLTDPVYGLVYDKTHAMASPPPESGWWSWLFGRRIEQSQNIDLSLPSYPDAVLRVDLEGDDAMAVGVILLGQQRAIGLGVNAGASVGIQDYSRKEKNDFGDTVLVERAFAKRASFSVVIDNNDLDELQLYLASVRATPCLWVGRTSRAATSLYGFYTDFDISISYADHSDCSIELEGLT